MAFAMFVLLGVTAYQVRDFTFDFFFFVLFSFLSFVMSETILFLVGAGRVNPDRISKIFYIPSKKRGLSDNCCRMCNLTEIN